MRILFIASDFPNPLAPAKGVFNLALARALSSRHEVRVISPVSWIDLWRGKKTIGKVQVTSEISAWHPRYLYPPKILRNHYDWFYRLSIRRALSEAMEDFKPDAVLGYWAHPDGAVAGRIAREIGVPSAVIVGGSDVLLITRDKKRRNAVVRALNGVDAVISVNQHLKQKVVELGISPEKVCVWSQGVDDQLFHPGDKAAARERLQIKEDGRVLICVARLVPVKGIDVLLNACAVLSKQNTKYHLYLLGDGPLRQALEKQAGALKINEAVTFVGSRTPAQLADWYQAADLTVLSSRSEGLPNVLRESVACGTPFVATDVGGIREIAGMGDRLVPPENPAALAEAIATLPPLVAARRLPTWLESADALAGILNRLRLENPDRRLNPPRNAMSRPGN